MFDIAFSELLVIALVALIVLGPERLPKLARTAGHLWGRAQRYVNRLKSDIARGMAVEEANKLQQDIQQHVAEVERAVQENGLTLEQSILQAHHKRQAEAKAATAPHPPEISEK